MRTVAWALAVAGAAIALQVPGAAARAPMQAVAAFDPDDSAYAAIVALYRHAEDLTYPDEGKPDEAAAKAAWDALYAAASKVRVKGSGLIHPLAGRALIERANDLDTDGNYAAALPLAEQGLAMLRPFREAYPEFYLQAISSVGFYQVSLGKPSEAIAALAEGSAWGQQVLATLPEPKKTKGSFMALSNVEFSLSQALIRVGRSEEALDHQRLSMEARRTRFGEEHPDTVASMYGYAIALFRAGKRLEAEAMARRAADIAIAKVDPKHLSYARSLEALSLILSRTGRRAEGVAYSRRAVDVLHASRPADDANYLYAVGLLGLTLLQLERYPEATAMLDRAVSDYRATKGKQGSETLSMLALAGTASLAEGRIAQAVAELQEAYDGIRTRDAKEWTDTAKIFPLLIDAKLAMGDRAGAQALAADYVREARARPVLSGFDIAYAELMASAAAGPGAPPPAQSSARLLELVRGDRALSESGELPQEQRAALDEVLHLAVTDARPDIALDAMVILAGSKIAQANRLVAERLTASDPRLAALVRDYQDATRAYQDADRKLLSATVAQQDVAAARAARDGAERGMTAAREAIQRDAPDWIEARGAERPDLAELQRGLAPDAAIVGVIPAFSRVYVLTITARSAEVREAESSRAALSELATRLRASLPGGRFDGEAAHALYAALFPAPTLDRLKDVATLRIVPTGSFAALPFAALLQRPVTRIDARAPWLVRRFAIGMAGSFSAPARAAATLAAKPRFLGVGDPLPYGDGAAAPVALASRGVLGADRYFRGGTPDRAALATLPPLPGAAAEVRAVATRFGVDRSAVLLGGDATEARLKAMDLAQYDVILFATHGLVSGEMEGVAEPALVLSPSLGEHAGDGVLTASEIAALRLNADWVILSACNTAAGDGAGAPAYSGLAQAFRYAGADTLLLSHWPVRDDAASFISLATIGAAQGGASRPEALRRAMIRLMQARGIPDAANPYVWAPYILLDGR